MTILWRICLKFFWAFPVVTRKEHVHHLYNVITITFLAHICQMYVLILSDFERELKI